MLKGQLPHDAGLVAAVAQRRLIHQTLALLEVPRQLWRQPFSHPWTLPLRAAQLPASRLPPSEPEPWPAMPPASGHSRPQPWAEHPLAQRLATELGVLAVAAAAVAALPGRIPQPASYHAFAGDQRTWMGVPHAPNVLSNAAIALPGAAGLLHLWRGRHRRGPGSAGGGSGSAAPALPRGEAACWAAAFCGMLAAGAGSARYHLQPTSATLAWDRAGMASAFAGLLAGAVAERRAPAAGLAVLPLALAAGLGSVLAWQAGEAAGAGDLRWYLLAQAAAGEVGRGWRELGAARVEQPACGRRPPRSLPCRLLGACPLPAASPLLAPPTPQPRALHITRWPTRPRRCAPGAGAARGPAPRCCARWGCTLRRWRGTAWTAPCTR